MPKTRIGHDLSLWGRSLLDFLFPRYCACCRKRLSLQEEALCILCLEGLPRVHFSSWEDNDIARLFWGLVPLQRAAAFFFYSRHSPYSRILFELKYHNHPETGRTMGRIMGEELGRSGFFEGIDLIVAIPLARNRERQRGYNQSVWIARGIAEVTGLPIDTQSVVRTVSNPTQTRLDERQRQDNVRNIFGVVHPERLEGRHILLVDDVITTGATMKSCAETISRTCHVRLSVLSLAWAGQT